jgi:hypothetical protein
MGIQPDIDVELTIAGVRTGRDEVLEVVVNCLQAGGSASTSGRILP